MPLFINLQFSIRKRISMHSQNHHIQFFPFCSQLQDVSSNTAERLCHVFSMSYNISEIFMITFFGNEIMVSSDRLSYCLFESDFVDRSVQLKKRIIIFAEYLKQPHQLMIAKLYPLTLETFTRVCWTLVN